MGVGSGALSLEEGMSTGVPDPNADRLPDDLTWNDDPARLLEQLRDCVLEMLEIVDEAHVEALVAEPGANMAGSKEGMIRGVPGVGWSIYERLVPLINDAQWLWYDTPAGAHLARTDGPVYLDEGRLGGQADRVAGSCFHELVIAVAVGLLDSIRNHQSAADYVQAMHTFTAAGTGNPRQVLANLASAIRCESRKAVERLERGATTTQPTPGEEWADREYNQQNAPTLFQQGHWDLTEAGVAAYCDHRFSINGCERRLLARLIRARGRAVHRQHLKEACGNEMMEDKTLQGHLSRLRKRLREHLDFSDDPIPYRDPGSYLLVLE
jgi:hypothetical protein